MTTFRTSRPTERSFQRDKQWQTPWHREWKHGKVQDDLPKSNRLWLWVKFAIMAVTTLYALHIWIVK